VPELFFGLPNCCLTTARGLRDQWRTTVNEIAWALFASPTMHSLLRPAALVIWWSAWRSGPEINRRRQSVSRLSTGQRVTSLSRAFRGAYRRFRFSPHKMEIRPLPLPTELTPCCAVCASLEKSRHFLRPLCERDLITVLLGAPARDNETPLIKRDERGFL
jgi:hypothetical protein